MTTQDAMMRWDELMASRVVPVVEVPTPATDALADIRTGLDLIWDALVAIGATRPGLVTLGDLADLLDMAPPAQRRAA